MNQNISIPWKIQIVISAHFMHVLALIATAWLALPDSPGRASLAGDEYQEDMSEMDQNSGFVFSMVV